MFTKKVSYNYIFVKKIQVLNKAIPSRFIVISILLITLGCLVASAGDLVKIGIKRFMILSLKNRQIQKFLL